MDGVYPLNVSSILLEIPADVRVSATQWDTLYLVYTHEF